MASDSDDLVGSEVLFARAVRLAWDETTRDSDEDVIVAAIYALAHHRYALVGDLRDLARHSLAPIREAVAFALSGHATPEAIALLVELTADVDDDVRDWATFAIGTQCDADSDDIRTALRDRLDDADEEVRSEAMVGLARRGDRVVIDRIVEALDSASPSQLIFDAADALLVADPGEPRITASLARWRDP